MAVVFSEVTLTANGKEEKLLASGIPRKFEDLYGWRKFEDFLDSLENAAEVSVHANAYQYGEGELFTATPEEVAYMMMRIDRRPNFLETSCESIDSVDFTFPWTPDEGCGWEQEL